MSTDFLKQMLLNTKLFLMRHDFVQVTKLREGTYWRRKGDGMIVLVSQKPDGTISVSLDHSKTKGKSAEAKAIRSDRKKSRRELRELASVIGR